MSADLTVRRRSRAISLTALIDVVFILLMFFMLTSSFSRFSYFEFQTQGSAGGASSGEAQVLVLLASGELVDRAASAQKPLSDAELLAQTDATRALSILPTADADVQTMVQAIERLNLIGLSKVTLGQVLPAAAE